MPSASRIRTILLVVLLCSLAGVIWRTRSLGGPPLELSVLSLFACFGYASVAAHYLVTARAARSRVIAVGTLTAAAAVVTALGLIREFDLKSTAIWLLVTAGCVGAVMYIGEIALAASSHVRSERLHAFRDALIVPAAVVIAPFFLWTNARINPVYDARVYGFEDILGVPFAYFAMRSYSLAGRFALVPTGCYLALPVGFTLLAAKQASSAAMTRVLLAVTMAGACGFVLYAICPAVGPIQALSVPFSTPLPHLAPESMVPMVVARHVPRNGMPSLHTVWALLIVWNAAQLRWPWRSALTLFAWMNVWAAMGAYQHWFMDLIVAVPLAAALQIAFAPGRVHPSTRRWIFATVCAAVTLAWLLALRFGVLLDAPPWLAWTLVSASVVGPFAMVRYPSVPPDASRQRPLRPHVVVGDQP